MLETLLKYASVYLASMVKFFFGPVIAYWEQLSFFESAIFSILGMMTTVFIILVVGKGARDWIVKKFRLDRKLQTHNVRLKSVWLRYGIPGIAFLTPPLLTPPFGAIVAIMFEPSRRKILRYMFVSAIFWGFAVSILFDKVGLAFFGF